MESPKFKIGDTVSFYLQKDEYVGEIYQVDANGIFLDDSEPYYDVYVTKINGKKEELILKHIRQSTCTKCCKYCKHINFLNDSDKDAESCIAGCFKNGTIIATNFAACKNFEMN